MRRFHEETAQYFGKHASDLFNKSHVRIVVHNVPPHLAAFIGKNTIQLGIEEGEAWTISNISPGIYTHELTHFLMASQDYSHVFRSIQSKVPRTWRSPLTSQR
jgi:hypothetical protein